MFRLELLLSIAAGGAIGSAARYTLASLIGAWTGPAFPWGTLAVNILGSFVMGVLVEAMALKFSAPETLRAFLTVGLLGGFTTFSAFSLEAALMISRNDFAAAAGYIGGSVVLCIAGLFVGLSLVRALA